MMGKMVWIIVSGSLLAIAGAALFLLTPFVTVLRDSITGIIFLLSFSIIALVSALYFLQRKFLRGVRSESRLYQERYGLEIKLREEKNRFEILFEASNAGIALLNLDGRLFRVNKAMCELLGYSATEMLAMNFYYLVHPGDLNDLQIRIQEMIDKKVNAYQSEQQCFRKNGEIVWTLSTLILIRDDLGKPIYFILQVHNISLQKQAEERLSHMAYHDPLTGLANRNKLEQFLHHILASSRRHQQEFALLFLDLDRFKNINDTIGHEAGDMLLQVIADRLRNNVRNTDMVARLGGDEFVLLITDVKKVESVAVIAQKVLESILKVVVIKGQEIYTTTSIGISLFPYDGQTMQILMKNADLALYRAKEHGRNNYQFYTSEMTGKAREKMSLQNALGHALAKNEFFLHYQPMLDLKTRRITGVEALLRWKNKEFGFITPDEIIALAEETGLIILVSEWIMKTACEQLKVWHDMGFSGLTLAINCSLRQFKQASFVKSVLSTVTDARLSPQYLEVEVTEKTILQDPETTLRALYSLKDLGVQVAIDDFGIGYWSLNNLRRLSVDKIKIDKSFIKQVTVDETSTTITRAIIAMVNKLGIKSIAEGVETREQYEFLAKEECTEIQGYYLTQPLSDEGMTRFLKHPVPDAEAISKGEIIT